MYSPPTFAETPIAMRFVANQNPDHQIQRNPELHSSMHNKSLVWNWIFYLVVHDSEMKIVRMYFIHVQYV